ncbi:MAG: 2Fe-2S iron-sulfur cluster binding domain-containing protein [Candidatus Izemoplasmatales bacterium]|jgi:Na+-transporting NADH:ubiquinone oxidoreductase subunit F|nr:2Fe-2S iron-sulfur cluster binding domain-containing protein [Candidatus Izemoplasmatales bacterium]
MNIFLAVNYYIPIIIIGLLLLITGLLILASFALGGNKEKTLTINNDKIIPVKGEDTLLNILSNNKIFIPSACGGKATCGFCKVQVLEGGGDVKPMEEPFLSAQERKDNVRLSCQVKVTEDIKISIPESLLYAKEYTCEVINIEDLTYDIKLVRFKFINPDSMEFKPGQYAQLKVPGIDIIRAYSIASNPKITHEIELIIRMVPKGKATTFVHRALELGDKVIVTGPYGNFYLQENSNRDIVCIAGGSGKAPIRSILHYLKDRGMPRKVKYFFGARSKKDLYYTEEFVELAKEFPNFEYIPALSDPLPEDNWEGDIGLITEVVDKYCGDLSDSEAYLCGSPGMINACINVLNAHNIKESNVFYDKFS